jgi:catechol 2,3-dioxygenase-like lactoylglutathione lyase family enzyme
MEQRDGSTVCRWRDVTRLRATASLAALLSLLASPAVIAPSQAAASPQTPLVRCVEAVGMTVSDIDRSIDFYSRVLSFEKVSDVEVDGSAYEHLEGVFALRMRVVQMRLGEESIELSEFLAPKGRPIPADSRSNDRWFQHIAIITSDMDRAYNWLRQNKVRHVSSGPQLLPDYLKAAAGIRAFYFEDPDGHPLEVLQFPSDKGDLKWHQTTPQLFLGVDHTAIVVGNTEASLKFYRDVLGFKVSGENENYGPEQEHLNSVFGARLRITSLKASSGPGIELLEYLAPTNGRSMPEDEHANDLMHHETRLVTEDIELASRWLRQARFPFISSAIVPFPKAEAGFHSALLVRDPDGHPMELVEK